MLLLLSHPLSSLSWWPPSLWLCFPLQAKFTDSAWPGVAQSWGRESLKEAAQWFRSHCSILQSCSSSSFNEVKYQFEVVSDCVYWAPTGCCGVRGDYPFISCFALWFYGMHSSIGWNWAPVSLVVQSALPKSQNVCLSAWTSQVWSLVLV